MQIHLHQTHHTIADFQEIFSYLRQQFEKEEVSEDERVGLHLFPELFLCGYPLQDLCLQQIFIDKYLKFIKELEAWVRQLPKSDWSALLGGLSYQFDKQGLPWSIKNDIYQLSPGIGLSSIYSKRLLPNYDIFDEQKYFSPGDTPGVLDYGGKKIGLLICEDMWSSSHHSIDPIEELLDQAQQNEQHLDLIVNLSASPFHLGKDSKRQQRAREISHVFNAPYCYVNRVGGEDEILFDGASFIIDGDKILTRAPAFQPAKLSTSLELPETKTLPSKREKTRENTWEALFNPQLTAPVQNAPPTITPLDDERAQEVLESLRFGLQEYAHKCGFNKFLVALSGGIDSAVVCALTKMSLKKNQQVEAIFMPGLFTSTESYDLSYLLCQNLQIPIHTLPIKFFHSSIRNAFSDTFKSPMEGITDENIQSRLRGALLYARSNQTGALVINTSNKSEIAVGYSTLYGDSVGALSLMGDLYKEEVFDLARYINRKMNLEIIPMGIIDRPPSAELRDNQKDEDSLPAYSRLDAILEAILSYRMGIDEIINLGFSEREVNHVYKLYEQSEYKRNQFCPILKIKAKSFGIGHRVPICKESFRKS